MFRTLRKLLFGEPKQKKRVYHFPLPYKIEAVYLHYGIAQLKAEGIFKRLPEEMQHKWLKASELWHDIRVTEDDLNQIDDVSWKAIADKLHLKWENDNEDESDIISGV